MFRNWSFTRQTGIGVSLLLGPPGKCTWEICLCICTHTHMLLYISIDILLYVDKNHEFTLIISDANQTPQSLF